MLRSVSFCSCWCFRRSNTAHLTTCWLSSLLQFINRRIDRAHGLVLLSVEAFGTHWKTKPLMFTRDVFRSNVQRDLWATRVGSRFSLATRLLIDRSGACWLHAHRHYCRRSVSSGHQYCRWIRVVGVANLYRVSALRDAWQKARSALSRREVPLYEPCHHRPDDLALAVFPGGSFLRSGDA